MTYHPRWLREGTVSIAANATAVTGTLTAWQADVRPGDGFTIDGLYWNEVESVESNTALTLARPWSGTAVAGSVYAIDRRSVSRQMSSDTGARLADYLARLRALPPLASTDALKALRANATGDNFEFGPPIPSVPSPATGDALKALRANATGSALEFGPPIPSVPTPAIGDALKALRANATGDALEFGPPIPSVPTPAVGDALRSLRVNANGTAFEFGPPPVSPPNLIINGDFIINQRQFAGGALAASAFGHDRWRAYGASSYTVATATGIVTLASGALEQVIEPGVWGAASFASKVLTVSVDSPSQDMSVVLGSVVGYITAGTGRRSVTLTLGAGDTGTIALRLQRNGVGSVAFARVRVEVGTAATDWVSRQRTVEEALAWRYFQRVGGVYYGSLFLGFFFTTSTVETVLQFPPLRAVPTVTIDNVGSFRASNAGVAQALTSIVRHAGVNHALDRVTLVCTLSAAVGTVGAGVRIESTATNAFINLSAEL